MRKEGEYRVNPAKEEPAEPEVRTHFAKSGPRRIRSSGPVRNRVLLDLEHKDYRGSLAAIGHWWATRHMLRDGHEEFVPSGDKQGSVPAVALSHAREARVMIGIVLRDDIDVAIGTHDVDPPARSVIVHVVANADGRDRE